MSRKYEGLIVIDAKGNETSIEELISQIGKQIEAEGATLDEVKNLGYKKFAYNARQVEGGTYVCYIFDAEPTAIDKIEKSLALNENIYLQEYLRRG